MGKNSAKRIHLFALILLFVLQVMSGCARKDSHYITKEEFFTNFIFENGLTSEQYTDVDILNCEDGTACADVMVEWGLLPQDLAEKALQEPVTKETVTMVCANATFGLKTGNLADIKDAEDLRDPQVIADAYASGIVDLEDGGYFDGDKLMTAEACKEIEDRALEYTSSFHFEPNTEHTSSDGETKEQDDSDYTEGDIIVEFY